MKFSQFSWEQGKFSQAQKFLTLLYYIHTPPARYSWYEVGFLEAIYLLVFTNP